MFSFLFSFFSYRIPPNHQKLLKNNLSPHFLTLLLEAYTVNFKGYKLPHLGVNFTHVGVVKECWVEITPNLWVIHHEAVPIYPLSWSNQSKQPIYPSVVFWG